MKKVFFTILICGTIILGITGCGKKATIKDDVKLNEIDGISMKIKEGTLTNKGATIIIEDSNGKGKYVYGTSFRIEKKGKNNWINPKETSNNCDFTTMAYYVNEEGLLEFDQNWECMYGELEKGTYRLIKDTFLSSNKPVTEEDKKYFSVEFTIEESNNNDNPIIDISTEKSCTYTETYTFIDYYENNDLFSSGGTFNIILEKFQSKTGPIIETLNSTNYSKDFIKGQNYEITYKTTIDYSRGYLDERREIIKIEPTNKQGLEQTQENCILK